MEGSFFTFRGHRAEGGTTPESKFDPKHKHPATLTLNAKLAPIELELQACALLWDWDDGLREDFGFRVCMIPKASTSHLLP